MSKHTTDNDPAKSIFPNLFKMDGWKNIISGLGVRGRDKSTSLQANSAPFLHHTELTDLYKGDGPSSRVVSIIADDMVRAGWEIPQDSEGKLNRAQQVLQVKKQLNLALKWMRLYGGSIVVLDMPGTGAWDEPVSTTSTKNPKLRALRVYPSPRIELTDLDVVKDPDSPYFEDVEVFRIRQRVGDYFKVHHSRCLVFKGMDYPETLTAYSGDFAERYWGMSALSPGYDHLKILGAFLQGLGVLGEEFSVAKLRLSNLEELVSESNFEDIQKRTELIAVTKSLINAVLLGENEEYTRDTITFTGVADLLDRFYMVVAGDFGIPVTRLFGRSAAGLNATGEGDDRAYYDTVAAAQEVDLLPQMYKLMQVINTSEGNPVNAEDLTVEFNPVWTPSQETLSKMKKEQAESDDLYILNGTLTSEEVRDNRFVGGYSPETSVEARPEGYTPEKELSPEEAALVQPPEKKEEK